MAFLDIKENAYTETTYNLVFKGKDGTLVGTRGSVNGFMPDAFFLEKGFSTKRCEGELYDLVCKMDKAVQFYESKYCSDKEEYLQDALSAEKQIEKLGYKVVGKNIEFLRLFKNENF